MCVRVCVYVCVTPVRQARALGWLQWQLPGLRPHLLLHHLSLTRPCVNHLTHHDPHPTLTHL